MPDASETTPVANQLTRSIPSIRAATPGDVEPAAQLIYATGPAYFDSMFGLGNPVRAVEAIARLFILEGNRFSYRLADVAELDGQVAGILVSFPGSHLFRLNLATGQQILPFYSWRDRVRLALAALPMMGDKEAEAGHYLVSNLAVAESQWGKGVGTALLDYADEKARRLGIAICTLDVDLDNSRARRLYQHVGYRVAQTTHYPARVARTIGPGFERMVKE